jgi:hypothetical protein
MQVTTDDYDFQVGTGNTPTESTGPQGGADNSTNYIFLESSGRMRDTSARYSASKAILKAELYF